MSIPNPPAPRRLIIGHHPDGSPNVHEDTVPTNPLPGNFSVAQAFMTESYEVDPIGVIEGRDGKVEGMSVPGGVVVRWVGKPCSCPNPLSFHHHLPSETERIE